jgi:hypothetical protein
MTNIEPIAPSTDTVPLIDRIKEAIDDYRYDIECGLNWIQVGDDFGQRMLSLIVLGGRYNIVVTAENHSVTYYFGGMPVSFSEKDMTVEWPHMQICIPWDSIRSLKRVG